MVDTLYLDCYNQFMPRNWNKGLKKETNLSVLKISQTMKRKKIDNFSQWRREEYKNGKWGDIKRSFRKTKELAELIGVILGDGNIGVFPRSQRLVISGDWNKYNFIKRYAKIVEKIFHKKPHIMKAKNSNAVRISLYQNRISDRLEIPAGNRGKLVIKIPKWILRKDSYILMTVKGLFEAEGSLNIHLPTYTYNFSFSNLNKSLLDFVYNSLVKFGFHPERRINAIRLRRKKEVERFAKLIKFRQY